jgi:hypothetical protein
MEVDVVGGEGEDEDEAVDLAEVVGKEPPARRTVHLVRGLVSKAPNLSRARQRSRISQTQRNRVFLGQRLLPPRNHLRCLCPTDLFLSRFN